jgi:hypothetical protein
VVLPSSVKKIGYSAFSGCNNLQEINLESIEEIGNNAFSGCEFNSVVIPKSVKEVEEYAFSDAHEIMVYDNIQSNIYQIAQKQELVREGIKYYTLKILSAETGELKYCIAVSDLLTCHSVAAAS